LTIEIHTGDCREVLKTLPDESVNCCVTSPPYWGLRDYGTATWEGGDEKCAHSVGGQVQDNKAPGAIVSGQRPGVDSSVCRKCGAVRIDAQLGLETTPDAFVAGMVDVLREVRRVLRGDGTLWLNLGDSYATGAGSYRNPGSDVAPIEHGGKQAFTKDYARSQPNRMPIPGLKPKDLVGIPWRVAFALQADGWYLRQDIIWSKPNPMPESVTDRCTKAHEYVFLLSKSARYYYDQEAILEPCSQNTHERLAQNGLASQNGSDRVPGKTNGSMHAVGRKFDPSKGNKNNPSFDAAMQVMPEVRNRRSVWTVTTKPFKGAHFATFPPALIRPCILAGCPMGGTVLDPFGGAGTTALVAEEEGRNSVLIELNPEYAEMARNRTAQGGLFCCANSAAEAVPAGVAG